MQKDTLNYFWKTSSPMKSKSFDLYKSSFHGADLIVTGQIKKNKLNEVLLSIAVTEKINSNNNNNHYWFSVSLNEYFTKNKTYDTCSLKEFDLVSNALLGVENMFLRNIYKKLRNNGKNVETIKTQQLFRQKHGIKGYVKTSYEIWKPNTEDNMAVLTNHYYNNPFSKLLSSYIKLDQKPNYNLSKHDIRRLDEHIDDLYLLFDRVVDNHKKYLIKKKCGLTR